MREDVDRSYPLVARMRIAADGIRGLSLRAVAQSAGVSLGTLSYRVGDKAALIAGLIEHELAERQAVHARWLERVARLDTVSPEVLAELILAYLDEAAFARRDAAMAGCELLLEAGRDPDSYPGVEAIWDAEQHFWAAMLDGRHPGGRALGVAIASYCLDELPFCLAIGTAPDYRLLRAATTSRIAAGLSGGASGVAIHFDGFVEELSIAAQRATIPVDLPHGSRKAELAGCIGDLIVEQGIAAITHRLVAGRAGIPNSSVAHHFRTRDDLLRAGMAALIQSMRTNFKTDGQLADPAPTEGMALLRTTHALTLEAARDPDLVPFAVDIRRRRGESVRTIVAERIGGAEGLDGAAAQAAAMALAGTGIASRSRSGEDAGHMARMFDILAQTRAACT
ncbi:MAG: TetR/AcrR family transcriptional regulator [Pseudomonadota bacterium]